MRRIGNRPLWVGHAGDIQKVPAILAAGIEAVIELADSDTFATLPRELIRCRFPLADGSGNPSWLLRLAAETLAAMLREGVPVLVCCSAGMSRSICLAAAALALTEGKTLAVSLKEIAVTGPADVSPALLADVSRALHPRE
jgi:hypothetical protein